MPNTSNPTFHLPSDANDQTAQREALEGAFVGRRAVELELEPVRGNFDAAHLLEINRRLFQDLPGAGFDDVKPGIFREATPPGNDRLKLRGLDAGHTYCVAYSAMDSLARARLDKALETAKPESLRAMTTGEFASFMATLYTQLDYAHPFSDGNSRTLRVFTQQLAHESGFDVQWEKLAKLPHGRDLLYVARDLSVNQMALEFVQSEGVMRRVSTALYQLKENKTLHQVMQELVKPSQVLERTTAPPLCTQSEHAGRG